MQTIKKEQVTALKEEGLNLMKDKNPDRDKLMEHIESVVNAVMSMKSRRCPAIDSFLEALLERPDLVLKHILEIFEKSEKELGGKTAEDRQYQLYLYLGGSYGCLGRGLRQSHPLLGGHDWFNRFMRNLRDSGLINRKECVDFIKTYGGKPDTETPKTVVDLIIQISGRKAK